MLLVLTKCICCEVIKKELKKMREEKYLRLLNNDVRTEKINGLTPKKTCKLQ